MPINQLSYEKSWMEAADFPTQESNESKVRADMQYFPDVIRDYINLVLLPGIAAELMGITLGTVQDGSISTAKLDAALQEAVVGAAATVTLAAAGWGSEGQYALSDAHIKSANTVVDMFVAPSATDAQRLALREADIVCVSQTSGGLTLRAKGTVPVVDAPVLLFFRQDIAEGDATTQPRLVNHIAPPGQKFIFWNGTGEEPAVVNGAILVKYTV